MEKLSAIEQDLAEYVYYDSMYKSDPLYEEQAKKLQVDLDKAVKEKNFKRAGEINEKLAELEVHRKRRKAQQCKQLLEEYKKKECREKRRKRWKFNFVPKKHWESKSNM